MKEYSSQIAQFSFRSIFTFLPKSARKASEGRASGKYPFYTSSQSQTKWVDKADYDVDALILGTGGGPSVHLAKQFSTSTDVFIVTPNREDISIRYIYYFLIGNIDLLQKGFKGVGLKHISKNYLCNLEIPLPVNRDGRPDYHTQEKLADSFERIERLKFKNEHFLTLVNELVPSIYSSYFKGGKFEKARIKDLVQDKGSIRTGPFGSQLLHSEFTDHGIPVLGIDNVVTNQFRWAKERYLPPEKFKQFDRFKVYPQDLIVTIMGTVGRVCVAPDDLPETMSTKHLCVITFDRARIHPKYAWAALLYDNDVRDQTRRVNKGAIMEGWNSQIIKNLLISVPPYPMQEKFAQELQGIQETRNLLLKQKALYQELFNSVLSQSLVSNPQRTPSTAPAKKTRQNWFTIKQGIGAVLEKLAQTPYERGEMVVAKYMFFLQEIYKVPFGLQFVKHKFGPYDPNIKKAIASSAFNKDHFFKVKGSAEHQVYSLGDNADTLMRYTSEPLKAARNALDELMEHTKTAKSSDIERLASVCKVVQDSQSIDESLILAEMETWKPKKFTPDQIRRSIAFIKANSWDKLLLK